MNWEVDILDTSQLQFEGDFDAQVQEILSFVRLTADKVHNLKQLFDDLEHALQHLAPGCDIQPFGSVVTGLGIRTSDVDCYVALPPGQQPTREHVVYARNILRRYHRKFTQIFAITKAKVPIVKFLHIPTNCYCDVNFKSPMGVQNSNLIAFLLHWDKRVLPLAVLIKYWSKVHKFSGTNLMGNYSLIMMVIFYLQLMNILPAVYELQKNVPSYMIDNWNTAFDNRMCSSAKSCDTLYDLMGGFFKCYSTFNFKEDMISPYFGRVINKKCFEDLDKVPEEFSLYKDNVLNNICKPISLTPTICIQDPFEHDKNFFMSNKLMAKIVSLFQFASQKYEADQAENFLRAIYTQDPNTMPINKAITIPKHVFHNKVKKPNRQKVKHGEQTMFHAWFAQVNSKRKRQNKQY